MHVIQELIITTHPNPSGTDIEIVTYLGVTIIEIIFSTSILVLDGILGVGRRLKSSATRE